MSLILEALKKSEAQRRLGAAPDLSTPFMPIRKRRSLLPWLIGAIVLSAVAGWWWTGMSLDTLKSVASQASQPIVAEKTPAPSPAAPITTIKPESGSPMNASSSPIERTDHADATTPALSKVAPTVAAIAATDKQVTPPLAVTAKTTAPAAVTPTPVTMPPAADAAAVPTSPSAATSDTPSATDAALSTTQQSGDAPASASPAPAAAANALPYYFQLPFAVRKDLPAIKISMHVYAVEAAQRFVIINGTRTSEGESVGTDLILREIRPAEIVLEFHNQRFIVPRTGSG